MKPLLRLLVASVLTLGSLACDLTFFNSYFSRCQTLTASYDVYWNVYANNTIIIGLHLSGNSGGWLGFGFSEGGGMVGADILVSQLVTNANGVAKYNIEDRYGYIYGAPQVDPSQDVTLVYSTYSSDSTLVIFSRKLVPCDTTWDNPIYGYPMQVIYAWGPGALAYHGAHRGTTMIDFVNVEYEAPAPADASVLTFRVPAHDVDTALTSSICNTYVLPNDKSYHVTRIQPVITSQLVRSVILVQCVLNPNSTSTSTTCSFNAATGMTMGNGNCFGAQVWYSSGRGDIARDFTDYALAFGVDSTQYVVMQVNYYNPNGMKERDSTTALYMTYSSETQYSVDLGNLLIGVPSAADTVVPAQSNLSVSNECPDMCTEFVTGSTIVGINFFVGQAVQSVSVQHIRGDEELEPLFHAKRVDFTHLHYYPLNVSFNQKDRFFINCTFNNSGNTPINEMCFASLLYYPIAPLFGCFSIGTKAHCKIEDEFIDFKLTPIPRPAWSPWVNVHACETIEGNVGVFDGYFSLPYSIILLIMCILGFVYCRFQHEVDEQIDWMRMGCDPNTGSLNFIKFKKMQREKKEQKMQMIQQRRDKNDQGILRSDRPKSRYMFRDPFHNDVAPSKSKLPSFKDIRSPRSPVADSVRPAETEQVVLDVDDDGAYKDESSSSTSP